MGSSDQWGRDARLAVLEALVLTSLDLYARRACLYEVTHTRLTVCVKRDHVSHPLRGLCLLLICGEFSSSLLCFQTGKTKAAGMDGHHGRWCRQSAISRAGILPYPSQRQLSPSDQGSGSRHSSQKPLLAATEKQIAENANKNWTIISENKYCKYKWWIGERMDDLFHVVKEFII